jgi:hypothetical protein
MKRGCARRTHKVKLVHYVARDVRELMKLIFAGRPSLDLTSKPGSYLMVSLTVRRISAATARGACLWREKRHRSAASSRLNVRGRVQQDTKNSSMSSDLVTVTYQETSDGLKMNHAHRPELRRQIRWQAISDGGRPW